MRADEAAVGKYATFGSYVTRLDVGKLNLSRYNRIRFELFSDCPGLHRPIVRVAFVNDGKIKIPDAYSREGFHAMNLENRKWNTMMWEIDSLAHDKVTEISFTMHRYGKEISGGAASSRDKGRKLYRFCCGVCGKNPRLSGDRRS